MVFASGCYLDRIAHVVPMAVGDEDGVQPLELVEVLGAAWVVHHPGVDQDDLSPRQVATHGGMAQIGELGTRVLVVAQRFLLPRNGSPGPGCSL